MLPNNIGIYLRRPVSKITLILRIPSRGYVDPLSSFIRIHELKISFLRHNCVTCTLVRVTVHST